MYRMAKLCLIILLSLAAFWGVGQTDSELAALLNDLEPTYVAAQKDYEENLLNTIDISLDKANNRINFSTPHVLKGIDITIKQRGEKVILQQNNMTISKHYSITFPAQAGINQYTIILQQDNHLLVERLEKDWL